MLELGDAESVGVPCRILCGAGKVALTELSDEITAQVYEDTTGLRFGDPVTGDGCPLSVRLSPGLLGGIFDGLLRPLSGLDTPFIPRGARRLSQAVFAFEPAVDVVIVELLAPDHAGQGLTLNSLFFATGIRGVD